VLRTSHEERRRMKWADLQPFLRVFGGLIAWCIVGVSTQRWRPWSRESGGGGRDCYGASWACSRKRVKNYL